MEYSLKELLAVDIAHTIADGEVGFTGLATGKDASTFITMIPTAAMELARRTHAPNMSMFFCGVYYNPDLSKLKSLPNSAFEKELAELPCEAQMTDYPGIWAHRNGDLNFGFGSGAQVDRFGNINSTCIGDYKKPKVALVGPIFLPEHMTCFGREYIMMPRHDKRSFVERVDYISGVGYPGGIEGRRSLGLASGGPKYIYTPKCVFSFDEDGLIYLKSVHRFSSLQDVIDNTGFEIPNTKDVPFTQEPTSEELRILREEVDPNHVFFYCE